MYVLHTERLDVQMYGTHGILHKTPFVPLNSMVNFLFALYYYLEIAVVGSLVSIAIDLVVAELSDCHYC